MGEYGGWARSLLKRSCLLIALLLMAGVVLATPAAPVIELDDAEHSAWSYNLWKSLTYETAASLDGLVFGLWFSGMLSGTAFWLGNYVLAGSLYYVHEMTWNRFGPDPNEAAGISLSTVKMLTYRVVSTTRVLTTSWLLTGSPLIAGGYAIANNIIDAAVYFANDLAWNYWGPRVEYLGTKK